MTKREVKLTKAYKKYTKNGQKKKKALNFLRSFMPEMIFRTTRLEGEKITRRSVNTLLK